jgi:hypothetical protein
MKKLLGASLTIALATAVALPAFASDLPQVKVSDANQVPACATPGRLMAYLRTRNPDADPRFEGVATEYMRHGEALGLRWDIAFFQMILETGALRYNGDVRSDQNNFAGLGASGGGQHGESFQDVSSGVKAHLQHLLMYAGEHIDNPVAERTRKVQEWGVLTKWQQSLQEPVTFAQLAKQWAPGSRGYGRDMATISEIFYDTHCNAPDPQPELVQEARMGRDAKQVAEAAPAAPEAPQDAPDVQAVAMAEPEQPAGPSATEIASKAIEDARKDAPPRASLGAGMLGTVAETAKAAANSEKPNDSGTEPAVTLINPSQSAKTVVPEPTPDASGSKTTETAAIAAGTSTGTGQAKVEPLNSAAKKPDTPVRKPSSAQATDTKGGTVQMAAVAGAATQMQLPDPANQSSPNSPSSSSSSSSKCKVWTASYGGQRAVLIKATADATVNYTVLDVNEAAEKREVDAYIAAYAKGGENIGAFPSQTKALDKAFELCPEG